MIANKQSTGFGRKLLIAGLLGSGVWLLLVAFTGGHAMDSRQYQFIGIPVMVLAAFVFGAIDRKAWRIWLVSPAMIVPQVVFSMWCDPPSSANQLLPWFAGFIVLAIACAIVSILAAATGWSLSSLVKAIRRH